MITVVYTAKFVREYKKMPLALREEVDEKIALFEENPRNLSLRLHKLKGKLKGYWSFSVNYAYRIVLEKDDTHTYALLMVGNHDVYQ